MVGRVGAAGPRRGGAYAPPVATLDPRLILCEHCGYDLTRMPAHTDSKCPECGKPVHESLPERRIGSAWQRQRGWTSWWMTNWRTLRRPRTRWDEIRVDGSGFGLTMLNCAVAAQLPVAWLVTIIPEEEHSGIFDFIVTVGIGVVGATALWILLLMLSRIETWGICFFGARRGWRTTRAVATTVVGHASVGWMAGPIIALPFALLAAIVWRLPADWPFWNALTWVVSIGALAQFVVPLLLFETFVYIGFRRMRFANRVRTGPSIVGAEGRAVGERAGGADSGAAAGVGGPLP